ncbi:hypothetical protein RIF29_05273 [Crotalaria pallida]|uniref:Uncharacterized protein n=1 Tax=Crotalaria pallida TaxID=3830 RepID=A0AAN9J2X6_CROPI
MIYDGSFLSSWSFAHILEDHTTCRQSTYFSTRTIRVPSKKVELGSTLLVLDTLQPRDVQAFSRLIELGAYPMDQILGQLESVMGP